MFPPEKIEEWINEAQQRPASAALIIQFIANRLAELSEWNEKLRAENIALRTGQRVQEYQQQIKHLEYQLELLKRQVSEQSPDPASPQTRPVETDDLLIYDSQGRILRLKLPPTLEEGATLAALGGLPPTAEPARFLVAAPHEELFCVFASGSILPLTAASLPLGNSETPWQQAPIQAEPPVGDSLACLVPISQIALADFILQISRRGYAKKIRMALTASILEKRYIGRGAKLPGDQTLAIHLGREAERYALLSREGYLQAISAEMLLYAVVEVIRLNSSDHLVAAFPYQPGQSILAMTQPGKAILREAASLEVAEALERRGKPLYSAARRGQGVRVVGGGAVNEADWGLALHQGGALTLHAVAGIFQRGTIPLRGEALLGFVTFQPAAASPQKKA